MSYCPACGSETTEDDRYCPNCGADLDGDGSSDRPHDRGLIEFTLRYPFSNGWMPLIIGAGLSLLGVFILPLFILYGYAVRVGQAGAAGADRIPDYDDWVGLLTEGVLLFVAFLPIIFIGLIVFGGLTMTAAVADTPAAFGFMVLFAFPLGLLLAYFGGAILPTYIATGSVGATYRDLTFLRFALTFPYLKGFVLFFALQIVVGILAAMLAFFLMITIIGILLIFPLYLLVSAYLAYLLGSLWGYILWETDAGPLASSAPDAITPTRT